MRLAGVCQGSEKVATFGDGFDHFCEHLMAAAHRRLSRLYPDFVADAGGIRTLEQALQHKPPASSGQAFKEYRDLLTLTLDLEMSVRNLRAALHLFTVTPEASALTMLGLQEHEWRRYHLRAWTIALSGVFDRAKELVPRALRVLQKHDREGAEAVRARLVGDLEALQRLVEEDRNTYAHGGSDIDIGGEGGRWELFVACRYWPELDRLYQPGPLTHEQRVAALTGPTVQTIAVVSAVLQELTDQIDWTRGR